MIRAAKLEQSLYEEIAHDQHATRQALVVVLLSSLAAGIGAAPHVGPGGLVTGGVVALLAWYIWTLLTYIIGAKLFPMSQTSARHREIWRAFGFASAPGVLRVFGAVPGLTGIAFLVAVVWMLLAAVIGVRQALNYTSTVRAVGVCVPGWLVQVLLLLFLLLLLGQGG
jgi:hypothetical protein